MALEEFGTTQLIGEPGGPIGFITALDPTVTITSPSGSGVLGSSVTVSGIADCDLRTTNLSTGQTSVSGALSAITKVEVNFGDGVYRLASKQGQGGTWAQWSITRSRPSGTPTIIAQVTASSAQADVSPMSDTDSVVAQIDATGPNLSVNNPPPPPENLVVTWIDGGVDVDIDGTASDSLTGVSEVKWDLNGQNQFTPATATAAGFASWKATVRLPSPGDHTITVRAKDGRGNSTVSSRTVTAEESQAFQPSDPDNAVSLAVYLDDLLSFATRRVKVNATDTLDRPLLAGAFYQPFDALSQVAVRSAANQPVHQVRLCIEVLHKYLADKNIPEPAEAMSSYLEAAYRLILRQFGSSFDEVRLARVADAPTRAALANRLGIDLSLSRPDQLDSLILDPASMTEANLEGLFGLEVTTNPVDDSVVPPTARVVPDSQLLTWRLEHLRALWQTQDAQSPTELDNLGLIVDPDIIGAEDLRDAVVGDPAYDLWQARQGWVASRIDELRGRLTSMRQAQASDLEIFDAIADSVVGPVSELVSLLDQHRRGDDIRPQLAGIQLSLNSFLHIMRVRELAASAAAPEDRVVLDSEWEDVYSILTQAQKVRETDTWRDEELAQGLALGPDSFKLADGGAAGIALPRWRASRRARRDWLDRLEGRITQEQAAIEALQQAVAATEEATMPGYRDALVAATDAVSDPEEVANQLTNELAIDTRSSGIQKTTRVNQAIVTLQTVLFSLRTGRFVLPHPASGWALSSDDGFTEQKFDESWRWYGAYSTWRAAMVVFAYPENYLLPTLREAQGQPAQDPTAAFESLVGRLRDNPRLTPVQTRVEAGKYLDAVRDELGGTLPAPLHNSAFVITDQMSEAELAERRTYVRDRFNGDNPPVTHHHLAPNYLKEIFYFVPMLMATQLQKSGEYLAALDWYQTCYAYNLSGSDQFGQMRKVYYGLTLEESIVPAYDRSDEWPLNDLNPHADIAVKRPNAYTSFTIRSLVQCFLEFADAEFARDTRESIPRARALYMTALNLLRAPEMQPSSSSDNPFPPNPAFQGLRDHAELNLFKLRSGLNIAGMKRQTFVEVPQSQSLDLQPVTGSNGQVVSGVLSFQPTPYRYSALIDRSRQLVATAQQIEAAYLAAIEKFDAERYNAMKAHQDIDLAIGGLALQDARLVGARRGVTLAELQRERSQIQADHFQGLLDEGLIGLEKAGIGFMIGAAALHTAAAATSGIGAFFSNPLTSNPFSSAAQSMSSAAAAATTTASILQTFASYERRKQDWQLQLDLAEHEILAGEQQVLAARDHQFVVRVERSIARVQANQARETLDFLSNKFTNVEFYDWMRATMGVIYRYFLQQATATARLAQSQLAFERQESPANLIQADYWEVPEGAGADSSQDGSQPDRQGITGSARLLQDIARLDQHAFETNQRKLQLSQTFSLAQLAPAEFQRFRETGVMRFAFPMELFDQAFPGHYLRLIQRTRASVVALIPPTQGIRATLKSSGVSQVAVGQDIIQHIVVQRDPEMVALTSPVDATGVFDLQPQGEMLMPFEGQGVTTAWELEMPKAANPFDYRTIADFLITIDYTALHSDNYRQRVIEQLDGRISADRAFSFRHQFADQWYDLHNPERSATPMVVRFDTRRGDFPPNVEGLKIQQVALAAARADGTSFEVPVNLHFNEDGAGAFVGGGSATVDGVVSTRRSNGISWSEITSGDKAPVGIWQLAFPNTDEVINRFKDEEIEDILFVLTYKGETPAWPA